MFPNNPLFIEKLVQTKQDDILRELPDRRAHELQETERFPVRLRARARIWVPVGMLLALTWWFAVLH